MKNLEKRGKNMNEAEEDRESLFGNFYLLIYALQNRGHKCGLIIFLLNCKNQFI